MPWYVVKEDCTSCHLCADEVPDVFEMDEDDLAQVHDGAAASEREDCVDAADACPGECIFYADAVPDEGKSGFTG